MSQRRHFLSVRIWFQQWAHLGPESTVPMHPQLQPFNQQLFLDFCAISFPEWPPNFFGQHDLPGNLAESRYPPAGPLRRRKHLLDETWKCSTNLPNPRLHSCASSHVLVFPLNTGNLFLLLKPCHLVTGLFWDAMDGFACLFDVFYYSESTAMLTISTIFDSGLDPENHKHASYTKETWNPYWETCTRTKPHTQKRVDLKRPGGWNQPTNLNNRK